MNLLLSSDAFPAGPSLDDLSRGGREPHMCQNMSRSELLALLEEALDLIDEEDLTSFLSNSDSNPDDQ
jgi:hypothetical protein